ncbi:uncharacterized protein An14g03350 [Aspergillus niger]|uniref:Contig An14c0130, genomic contig n=2 Tax=Aspergillus niger TaxID=5061 RepID=A2R380_ASPNC|nr:uncharacterized protein An14g03350 [Aspergillus niger]CAK46572.1 unnamed protein product [Aspergillus niger]
MATDPPGVPRVPIGSEARCVELPYRKNMGQRHARPSPVTRNGDIPRDRHAHPRTPRASHDSSTSKPDALIGTPLWQSSRILHILVNQCLSRQLYSLTISFPTVLGAVEIPTASLPVKLDNCCDILSGKLR